MRKSNTLTIRLDEGDRQALEAIALEFGLTWGDSPNVSQLIGDIAKGKLRVTPADVPPGPSPKRVAIQAAIALIQEGLSKLLRLL